MGDKSLVIDVGGVGYGVHVPENVAGRMRPGETSLLTIYHHIKENINELYGFEEPSAKELFELLISVSGVGPKSALAIMSLGEPDRLRQAIAADNVAYIAAAAGIGQRSAQRICSELQDKVGILSGPAEQLAGDEDEALAALLSLGYSRQQALTALTNVDRSQSGQDQVKAALRNLK